LVARQHFGLPDEPNLNIQIGDGGESIMQRASAHDSYDLILIDIFDDQGLAPSLMESEVFEPLPLILNRRGWWPLISGAAMWKHSGR
jgi:spermidine synthase